MVQDNDLHPILAKFLKVSKNYNSLFQLSPGIKALWDNLENEQATIIENPPLFHNEQKLERRIINRKDT